MSRTPRRLAAAAAALALAACGGDDEPAKEATGTTTTASAGAGEGVGGEAGTTISVPTHASSTTAAAVVAPTTSPASTTPGAPAEEAAPGVIELSIVGGDVQGGVRREKVEQGAQVTIRVTSDVADELHVHTYDLTAELVPGQSADLTFLAKIPGVHEVELEERGTKVLELEVSA